METRAAHLRCAANSLLPHVEMVAYGHIGKEQYEQLVHPVLDDPEREMDPHVRRMLRNQGRGLERVFHGAVEAAVRQTGIPTIVIQDESKRRGQLEFVFRDDVPIWQSGVIHHPSEAWPGIQLADLVSVVLSRSFRIEDKRRKGEAMNAFDVACEQIVPSLEGKLVDAWRLLDP